MNMKIGNVGLLTALLLVTGCARERMLDVTILSRASVATPQPPPILTTPAAFLLTNQPGFSARVRLEGMSYTGEGELFGRGSKLLFVPEAEKPDRHTPAGRYSFIWDVSKNEGVLLSDALQGWAPITMSGMGTATNVSRATADSLVKLSAQMNDGRELHFLAQSGRDSLPHQLQGGDPVFKAEFSRVRFETPDASRFTVPEGFTGYSSSESMVDELAARFRNLKKRSY